MKKLKLGIVIIISLLGLVGLLVFIVRPSAESYRRFTDIDYIVYLLYGAPTMEELEAHVGIRLRNRAERINESNRNINERRITNATTTTRERTTGLIVTPYGTQFVDLETVGTHRPLDSELILLEMVELTNILDSTPLPNSVIGESFRHGGRISFHFGETESLESSRLVEIEIANFLHFGGMDFAQLVGLGRDDVLEILNNTYGLNAVADEVNPVRIIFYYENIHFTIFVFRENFRINATTLI